MNRMTKDSVDKITQGLNAHRWVGYLIMGWHRIIGKLLEKGG